MQLIKKVSYQDKLLFTKYLSVMLKAGLPITEVIGITAEQTKNNYFKGIINKILADVKNGQSLHKSLSRFPKIFNQLYLSIVEVGEQSGNLEVNLEYLYKELEKSGEFKKKVQQASMYPGIILATAFSVGTMISIFVLPQLVNLFQSMEVKLPHSTQILLGFAVIMKDYGVFILAGTVILAILLNMFIRLSSVKPLWHRLLLNIPVFGKLICFSELAAICRNLGMMLNSGLPITKAINITESTTSNCVYKSYLAKLQETVSNGKSLGYELNHGKFTHVPHIVSKMVGVGEKTGTLEKSLEYLGVYFSEEVDDMAKNIPVIIEPLMLFVIAIMVGFLAFSIISPIYQFTASIHQ